MQPHYCINEKINYLATLYVTSGHPKWLYLVSLSTTTIITKYPLESGES